MDARVRHQIQEVVDFLRAAPGKASELAELFGVQGTAYEQAVYSGVFQARCADAATMLETLLKLTPPAESDDTCPDCQGTGQDPVDDGGAWLKCWTCDGTGKVKAAAATTATAG